MHNNTPVGLRGIIIDITDRKKTEKDLQISEKKYRQIFENVQTPYYESSLDGIILDVSPSVERFLKYKRKELIGRPILELYANPEQRERVMKKLLDNSELIDEEVLVRDKDGTVHTGLISATFIEDEQKTVGSLMDISDRKKAEEKLKTSEETFRSVVESLPMGIHMYRLVTDEKLVFTGANPAADRILGVDNSQFIGQTIEEAFPQSVGTEMPSQYCSAAAKGTSWYSEQVEYKDNQIEGAFEVHAFQMAPGSMAAIFYDVTERRQAEQALKDSEERFRQLAENIKEVFWIVSPDWSEVYYVSPAFKEIWQLSEKDLYQNAFLWLDAINEEDRKIVEAFIQEKQKGDLSELIFPEYRIMRLDGTERWIFARGFPVYDENGQIYRIAGIAEDITERKKTQEIMVQTEKMMSVGGLAAGMAHEINNPLSAILQGTQNLIRRLSPDLTTNLEPAELAGIDLRKLQTYLESRGIFSQLSGIQDAGKKASEIISNMLQFSRKSESTMAPTDLLALIENVLDLVGQDYDLSKEFDFRNIEIVREFDSDLPLVPCTETEIEQVILNLLNNASWAIANQNADISPRITLRALRERDMARIEVEDNGPGMNEETRKRAFEPFYTTKPVGKGTGLGLSVSYMIISQNHHGTIEADSELGRGTNFIIRLPLNRETRNNLD